jgi:cytochrome c
MQCSHTDAGSSTSQSPEEWPSTFGFGRVASFAEIDSLDIDVNPAGKGLGSGSGNVLQGKIIYLSKCAVCHGKTGVEGPYTKLVGEFHESDSLQRGEKTIGNYWPYATTLYDYINRAMPYTSPGTLTSDEVYSLTAFLLYRNNIIDSTIVLDANNLPQVIMPAQKLFIEDDRQGGPEIR